MPILSDYARKKKAKFFLERISGEARVLEVGCGEAWVGEYLANKGCKGYVGLDLAPPADVVGDIRDWPALGLEPESFDVIIAFEVVEHVDCFKECYELLKQGGMLMLTSPVPSADRVLRLLELIGLNQKRGSPHDNLVDFRDVPYFEEKQVKIVGLMSQWGVFTKLQHPKGSP